MSEDLRVSIEDVITAATMTVQAGLLADDELSAGETKINTGGADSFRGTANGALGEFTTYLSKRRQSLGLAVDDIVQGLRGAAIALDTTDRNAADQLQQVAKHASAQRSSVLDL
ncbi:hypothetical protein DFR67_11140 [Williamsia limnetica]|uniref:Uncharacterized protein n=1 Tax=Williamsia limnetica TaxID=882452 RepID=A0A318RXQ0_WILLI|nr:hypothetical protein [Williamsia limnetica]PYE14965.1 hypothetical protein DFR67_11140 [Williamsia limnetica]